MTLLREMGQDTSLGVELITQPDLGPTPPVADSSRAFEARAEMKLARKEIERTQADFRLQKALARPDLEVLGGYKYTAGYSSVIAGIQMAVPTSNRNQVNISAASAESRAARSYLSATESLVRSDVAAAQRNVESKRRQLEDYLTAARRRAVESATIAGAAYREGGADLLRLLDAERVRIDLEVLYARTVMEYRQSIAALEAAMGVMP